MNLNGMKEVKLGGLSSQPEAPSTQADALGQGGLTLQPTERLSPWLAKEARGAVEVVRVGLSALAGALGAAPGGEEWAEAVESICGGLFDLSVEFSRASKVRPAGESAANGGALRALEQHCVAQSVELRQLRAELTAALEQESRQAVELDSVRGTVEGMRAEYEQARAASAANRDMAEEAQAEVDRLKVELADLRQYNKGRDATEQRLATEMQRVREQLRLRALERDDARTQLERVAGERDHAREALAASCALPRSEVARG